MLSGPSKITPKVFQDKIRQDLSAKGLSHHHIEQVEGIVKLSLDEPGSRHGLDRHEVEAAVAELRNNRDADTLSSHQIDIVKEVLEEHLK